MIRCLLAFTGCIALHLVLYVALLLLFTCQSLGSI